MDTVERNAVFLLGPRLRLEATHSHRRGMTCGELLVAILWLFAIILGAIFGAKLGEPHGGWVKAGGAVLGAVGGGLSFAAFLFVLALPLCVVEAIRRAMEPADFVCRCREPSRTVAAYLLPQTPIQCRALEESHRLGEWPEYAPIRSIHPHTVDDLRTGVADGSLSAERIALAARLGDPAANAVGAVAASPLLVYPNWARLPKDVHAVLRSGLPPRLCLAWALACVERALPVFEAEFHEDTRPRQFVGATLMFIRDGDTVAARLCGAGERYGWPPTVWDPRHAGCRVLHRDLLTRLRGRPSKGEHAAEAAWALARAVSDFVEPSGLWNVYGRYDIANGYITPRNRCAWCQPAIQAEKVAGAAILAEADAEAERQWQREELARMILGWQRWDEDREAWRICVEEEWIPRVRDRVTEDDVRFDVPAYLERIRRELVPWSR